MGKLVVTEFVSLDGVMPPGDELPLEIRDEDAEVGVARPRVHL